jgi:hypothetical protein
MTDWRFDATPEGLILAGGCGEATPCNSYGIGSWYQENQHWAWNDTGFKELNAIDTFPWVESSAGLSKFCWTGSWWEISALGTYLNVRGNTLPASVIPANGGEGDLTRRGAEMGYFPMVIGQRILLFGKDYALSMDSAMTVFHTVSWPGSGSHFEMTYGPGILSVSNAGVYVGTILPDSTSNPRGTWVEQTLVPSVF